LKPLFNRVPAVPLLKIPVAVALAIFKRSIHVPDARSRRDVDRDQPFVRALVDTAVGAQCRPSSSKNLRI
jgi:hypothetical protein